MVGLLLISPQNLSKFLQVFTMAKLAMLASMALIYKAQPQNDYRTYITHTSPAPTLALAPSRVFSLALIFLDIFCSSPLPELPPPPPTVFVAPPPPPSTSIEPPTDDALLPPSLETIRSPLPPTTNFSPMPVFKGLIPLPSQTPENNVKPPSIEVLRPPPSPVVSPMIVFSPAPSDRPTTSSSLAPNDESKTIPPPPLQEETTLPPEDTTPSSPPEDGSPPSPDFF